MNLHFENEDSVKGSVKRKVGDVIDSLLGPCGDAPIFARMLTPGFTEALVFSVQCATAAIPNAVIKFGGDPSKLAEEAQHFNNHASQLRGNPLKLKGGPLGLAYTYVGNSDEFKKVVFTEAETVIKNLLNQLLAILNPWYSDLKTGLAFPASLDFEPQWGRQIASRVASFPEGKALWERWNKCRLGFDLGAEARTYCVCHGDLHFRNLLVVRGGQSHSPRPVLIDFGKTGTAHCAKDFARMEREARFTLNPEDASAICKIADSAMFYKINKDLPTELARPLWLILEIRDRYVKTFGETERLRNSGCDYPMYFARLTHEMLQMFGYNTEPSPVIRAPLYESLVRLVGALELKPPIPFLFATFITAGKEGDLALVRKATPESLSSFPVQVPLGKDEDPHTVGLERLMATLIETRIVSRHALMASSFSPAEIVRPMPKTALEPFRAFLGNEDRPIRPIVCTIRTEHPVVLQAPTCTYRKIVELADSSVTVSSSHPHSEAKGTERVDKALAGVLTADLVLKEFSWFVLEGVDVIVFRRQPGTDDVKFLMRYRTPKAGLEPGGWEYPKGGRQVLESPREAALREFAEETVPDADAQYEILYELGPLTADVEHRVAYYQAVRLRGFAIELKSGEDTLHPERFGGEFYGGHEWMSLQEAKSKVWMDYGKEFFERFEVAHYKRNP